MTWLLLLACNRGEIGDSAIDPDRLVKLYGDVGVRDALWCAERADQTLTCFGTAELVEKGPGDQQWSYVDLECGCGLDLGGDPVCWKEGRAVDQLPAGPFSKLSCDGDWAWGIRADTGEFVVVAADMDSVGMEVGALVRDVLKNNISGQGQPNCYLTHSEGLINCIDFYNPETEFVLPEGEFESFVSVAGVECGLREDGSVGCFNRSGGEILGEHPDWPLLKETGWGVGLTVEHELVELTRQSWYEEYGLPLGGLYQSYFALDNEFHLGIPMDDPYVVDCLPEAVEEMEVMPPGWVD